MMITADIMKMTLIKNHNTICLNLIAVLKSILTIFQFCDTITIVYNFK